jgi:hypothetical protein
MDNVLSGINAIAGVIGSAAFDSNDACVAHRVPPPYEPILITQVMRELRAALGILSYLDDSSSSWGMFVVGYDDGYVIVRPVDESTTILVLASLSLNLSMLGIGFNVASLKIAQDRGGGTPAAVGSTSNSQPVRAGSQPVIPRGSSVSLLSQSGDDTVAPPNAVGPDVMNALLKSFAKQIGPFAKVILREELTKMGVTASTLVRAQYEDLVGMLVRRLPDSGKRKEFMADVANLPSRR